MMLFYWYKKKKAELKVKAMFWSAIAGLVDNYEPVIKMAKTLFEELKGVPAEELQSELVSKFAEIIHNENKNDEEVK